MMLKLWLLLFGLVLATDASAVGMTIAMYITGATLATAGIGTLAIAFAINMVVSTVISKVLYNAPSMEPAGSSPDPGNRQQVPPATDNKIPVVYGTLN
jgi:membrane protein implicated in regulation of membrane protease activity